MSVLTGKDVSFKMFDEYRYHQYVTSKNTNSITGSIIILYSKWAYNTPALFNTSFIIIVVSLSRIQILSRWTLVIILGWRKMAYSPRTKPNATYHQLFWKYACLAKVAQQKDVCVYGKLLRSCTINCGSGRKCQNIYNIVSEWFIFWK